jgi:hypothetical protein
MKSKIGIGCFYGVESSQDVSSDVIPTQRTDYFIQL